MKKIAATPAPPQPPANNQLDSTATCFYVNVCVITASTSARVFVA
jgi:hypothetical protein